MSYDQHDAAIDEMYERISEELYPEHKEQAVSEFTADRLQSFYLSNPMVMRPAVDALQEAKRLKAHGHPAAAVVFCPKHQSLDLAHRQVQTLKRPGQA